MSFRAQPGPQPQDRKGSGNHIRKCLDALYACFQSEPYIMHIGIMKPVHVYIYVYIIVI